MVHFPIGNGHVRLIHLIQIFSPLRGVEGAHGAFSNREWGFMSSSRSEVGAILRKLTIFKWGVNVYMTASRHQDSNLGPSHGLVLRGGDLEKIDDFQIGSERLHDCFRAFLNSSITDTFNLRNQFCVDL